MCSAAGAIAPFSIERPRSAASRTLALGTLIGTLVLSAPGTGRACTFPVPAPRPDEGDEVPVNTKVWAHAALGPCELWSQVEPLPTAVAQIGAMQILLPEQDLPKGETFDVVCGGVLASTFDVSLDADSVAPRAPTGRVSREYEQDGSCGEDGMDA